MRHVSHANNEILHAFLRRVQDFIDDGYVIESVSFGTDKCFYSLSHANGKLYTITYYVFSGRIEQRARGQLVETLQVL